MHLACDTVEKISALMYLAAPSLHFITAFIQWHDTCSLHEHGKLVQFLAIGKHPELGSYV